jgi:hypothetical protein
MPLTLEMTVPLPALQAAVEGLAGVNVVLLEALDGQVPRLYESAVRYAKPGKLRWYTVADLYDLLEGDCKDLAAARVAELRYFEGEDATAFVYLTRRAHRYHAVVRRADGTLEDPSRILLDRDRARKHRR